MSSSRIHQLLNELDQSLNDINQSFNEIDQFIHNSILSHAASIFSANNDERLLVFTIHSAFPLGKSRPLPASKTAIEALPTVEAIDDDECSICLTEYGGCEVKEMPCKHMFHDECVKKWLSVNGTCPVCRYEMPLDQEEGKDGGEGEGVGWQVMISVRRMDENVGSGRGESGLMEGMDDVSDTNVMDDLD